MTCKAILSIFHMFPSVNTASGSRVLSTDEIQDKMREASCYDTASGSRVLSTIMFTNEQKEILELRYRKR